MNYDLPAGLARKSNGNEHEMGGEEEDGEPETHPPSSWLYGSQRCSS